ncbi:MAG: formimidoylglutamate deiminase [Gammaproteobacteria bacterium]|nr:formimidoylglutamate deiminase [Gammaproteobacteria bacterium]
MNEQTASILNFQHILAPDGILPDRQLHVDGQGVIQEIRPIPAAERSAVKWDGYLALPGMPNAHSHVFQRALAGFGEARRGEDSFWSWREAMYRLALHVTPEQLHVIARQAYGEMLAAGFTSVAEFHYLHHLPDGTHSMAMADAIIQAAEDAGIRLCLLPVAYFTAGFAAAGAGPGGGQAPLAEQRRFVFESVDDYLAMVEAVSIRSAGIAPHSLRAVPPSLLEELVAGSRQILGDDAAIHIHIAEQQREVTDCRDTHGKTPINLLADTITLDEHWNLVHATHADAGERQRMLDAGARVVICPLTEAYLGDGLFDATGFGRQGGELAIGSDSNARIDVFEELRLLEYGQRLKNQARAQLADEHGFTSLYRHCAEAGARASGLKSGRLEAGRLADIIAIDERSHGVTGHVARTMVDALLVNGSSRDVVGVWVGGRKIMPTLVPDEFAATVQQLLGTL